MTNTRKTEPFVISRVFDAPRELLATVSLKDLGGRTEVTIEWIPLDGSTDLELDTFDKGRDSMKMGWTGTIEQFTAYLAIP